MRLWKEKHPKTLMGPRGDGIAPSKQRSNVKFIKSIKKEVEYKLECASCRYRWLSTSKDRHIRCEKCNSQDIWIFDGCMYSSIHGADYDLYEDQNLRLIKM
jgi:DNA-directed RNA polymerase subunit RPC12/RpoP